MKKIIFGYGSLLFPEWWNKTLKRKITWEDMIYLELQWFKRIWSPTSLIKFQNKIYNWLFLDIIESNDNFVNGFWVVVNDEEFNLIEMREKTYKMIDITEKIKNKSNNFLYYTAYLIDKNPNSKYGVVLPKKYYDFVETNLEKMSNEFIKNYRENTENNRNYKILDWNYVFVDEDINKVTWR